MNGNPLAHYVDIPGTPLALVMDNVGYLGIAIGKLRQWTPAPGTVVAMAVDSAGNPGGRWHSHWHITPVDSSANDNDSGQCQQAAVK